MVDLAYILRNNSHKCKTYPIVTSKNKCFNCYRIRYFRKNYKFFNYQSKKKNIGSSSIGEDWNNNLPRLKLQ